VREAAWQGVGMVEVRVRGLLFDSDGVLVDSTALVVAQWEAFAGWYGLPAQEVLADMHGRRAPDIIAGFADRLPVSVDEAYARLLTDPAGLATHTVPVLPGAAELLRSLPASGWAVVTSGGSVVAGPRLASAGLPAPPVLVTGDDVTAGKPDPAPYRLAAERLRLDPADCLVFEDAPAGLASARAAGCRSVGLHTTYDADLIAGAAPDYQAPTLASVTAAATPDGFLVRIA
jgi:mannitol-1-/sugar-/sorbitol-6-phosphatase